MTPNAWEVVTPETSLWNPYKEWSKVPNCICENMSADRLTSITITPADGVLFETGHLTIPAGATVSNISFFLATIAVAQLNQWFALIDAVTGALLGITADQTTTITPANTILTLPLTTPYRAANDQRVYACIAQHATTSVALLHGTSSNYGLGLALSPPSQGTDNVHTGLTNPASCPNPATIAANAANNMAWAALS